MRNFERLAFSIIIYFLGVSLIGLFLMPHLPVKLTPTKSLPQLTVSFSMNGQAPRIVESKVTAQIESMLSRINGVNDIQSRSSNGSGTVTITMDKHTDMDLVRFEVSTLIRQLWPQLPQGVSYPSIQAGYSDTKANYPVLIYTMNAPSASNLISDYVETQIRPKLAQIEGVSNIKVSGTLPMEWVLEYNNAQLEKLGLTIGDIQNAVARTTGNMFLGMADTQSSTGTLANNSLYLGFDKSAHFDLSQIPVKKVGGKIVWLNELVKVTYQEQPPRGFSRINGLNSISVTIYAYDQTNQIKLSKQIKKKIEDIKLSFPAGYELQQEYDASEYIEQEIDQVMLRSGFSILLLLLLILVVNRSLKYLAVIVISLTANITGAFIIYYFAGIEIQLYSLAGITISLGLVIDNIIVMADHLMHKKQMSIFMAILASTLTTIASLAVVFLLDEKTRLNLQDFSLVLIVNLGVSLWVSLLLVPALISKMKIAKSTLWHSHKKTLRRIVWLNRKYGIMLQCAYKYRKVLFVAGIIGFGIPLFMLPGTMTGKGKDVKVYNLTLGSPVYQFIRSYTDNLLGGSLKYFLQRQEKSNRIVNRGETYLNVQANLPNGATLQEMNEVIRQMEYHISTYEGVKQFRTDVHSPKSGSISVLFSKEGEKKGVPHRMKSELISKAVTIGNATWSIVGLGEYFSNNISSDGGGFQIEILGYNYDQLMDYAEELRRILLTHQRIKKVKIQPRAYYGGELYEEYTFVPRQDALTYNHMTVNNLYSSIYPNLIKDNVIAQIPEKNGMLVNVRLQSGSAAAYDMWNVNNALQYESNNVYRMPQLAAISRQQTPQDINKTNQQYRLFLVYDYIGDGQQAHQILRDVVTDYQQKLPIGYTIKTVEYDFGEASFDGTQLYALSLVVFIIFVICCVLFNSFKKPFVVILIIPLSYIGLFLCFGLLGLPFGQGGFAALVLLSGLTCNSVIYLLNDYQSLLRHEKDRGIKTYLKAFNGKIIPVLLTILSTALGFVPFMFDSDQDSFWLPLALGTISGLAFSLVCIIIFLPVMIGVGRSVKK